MKVTLGHLVLACIIACATLVGLGNNAGWWFLVLAFAMWLYS